MSPTPIPEGFVQGENSGTLENYLHFSTSNGDTVIDIKPSGAAGAVSQQIVLTGVDLVTGTTGDAAIISDLLNKGKLITD